MMMAAAEEDQGMGQVKQAFDQLTIGNTQTPRAARAREAAVYMFQEAMRRMGRAPEEVDDGQQEAEINRGFGVLQRFQTNQFEFDNGAGPNGGPSAAIYHFTSNVNHSCS